MKRVELQVSEPAGVRRQGWAVTQGIPFPDGELKRGDAVRLVAPNGRAVPVQARCLATWHADRQFVKWLLVDFQLDELAPREQQRMHLEYGGEWHDVPASPIRTDLVGSPPTLYMADQHGVRYESTRPDDVVIEEDGPLRTVVCLRGRHRGNGRAICPYVLRMHFFAGSRHVRVQHTFVFDQDAHEIELAEIGVHFAIPRGRFAVAAIRNARREHPKAVEHRPGEVDVLIWPKQPDGRTVCFTTPFTGKDVVFFHGTRDEDEFRRLVEAKPGAALNLKSTGAETREDLEWVERMVEKYAPGRPASYNDTGPCDGFGAAKTTEFWLRLSDEPMSDDSAAELARCIDEPVLALPAMDYICSTGAVRLHAPFDPSSNEPAEASLRGLFNSVVVEPRVKLRNDGMFNHGDLICSHSASPSALWKLYKDKPDLIERMRWCSRAYNNEANDQVHALWGFFLHFGERDMYLAAEAYGRHMADVDIIHAGPHRGLMHYHNAHHWSGGPSPSHTCIAGLMLQYYLTGDLRIFDVCTEVADWALAQREPCGIHANRGGMLVREFTSPVFNLLEYYQATWDERYGEMARRSLKWMLLAMPEPGAFPQSIYTAGENGDEAQVEQDGWHIRQAGGMTPQLLYDAVRLFPDDPIYRQCLIGLAQRYVTGHEQPLEAIGVGPRQIRRVDPYFNAPVVAYAFELTNDSTLAAYCRYYVNEHFPRRVNEEFNFTFVCWGGIIPPMLAAVARAHATLGRAALDAAERQWIARIERDEEARTPAPAQTPRPLARRSLGVIHGYD